LLARQSAGGAVLKRSWPRTPTHSDSVAFIFLDVAFFFFVKAAAAGPAMPRCQEGSFRLLFLLVGGGLWSGRPEDQKRGDAEGHRRPVALAILGVVVEKLLDGGLFGGSTHL